MYGRLGLEYMMMYSFGTSSLSAMLISLKSRKRKMALDRRFGDSMLVELSWAFRCWTGCATRYPTGA